MHGGGLVKGWPWGSASQTNTVVPLLHWLGASPGKNWKMKYLVHSSPLFLPQTKVADRFTSNKIGDEGL